MNESSWFLQNLDINHIALPYQVVIDDGDTIYQSYGHSGSPTYPAAQLRTSAVQYARHLIAFMQKGQIDGARILNISTVDSITTIQYPNLINEQALIWFIEPYTIPGLGTFTFCYHSGSSYGVRTLMGFIIDPYKNMGVVIFTNGESDIIKIWDALYIYANTISDIDEDFETPPEQYYLSQNYPNPFNPGTRINWQSPVGGHQILKVFDVLGNEVSTLVDEYKPAGRYEVEFKASTLPSGVYFYQLKAGEYVESKKMILLK
jgi:hypothetical protein